jgi:DNA-directed RNA polymerase beta subunit
MIQFDLLPQYTRLVPTIRFKQEIKTPYLIVYFSENSTFFNDYHKLGFRRPDLRHVVVPKTRVPVTRLEPQSRDLYKSLGLLPFSINMAYPKDKNIVLDLSLYLTAIENAYHPASYRQRAGFLVQDILYKSFNVFPNNYKKVLIYAVDSSKEIRSFVDRKVFPLIRQLKAEQIYFDHMLLTTVGVESAGHRLLIKNKDYKFPRLLQYIKRVKIIDSEEEETAEVNQATTSIMKKVTADLPTGSNTKIGNAIKNFLSKDKDAREKVNNGEVSADDMKRLAVASVLNQASGDTSKAIRLAKTVPKKNLNSAVTAVTKRYSDQFLDKPPTKDLASSLLVQSMNVPNMIDDKSPEHIFSKRHIDFETNLKKDMINAFKILEKKEIPLTFDSIQIVDAPPKAGEIDKSDVAHVKVALTNSFGKKQNVKIAIPKIDPTSGVFRVNGRKKCLINQIVLNPISFPKPNQSKFESSYSTFHIYSKKMKRLAYLEIYMGSFRLPLIILLGFAFGFKETLNQYGIKYKIVDEKPAKGTLFAKVPSSYIVFDNVNTDLKKELVESFMQAKVINYTTTKEFGTKEYFTELIIKITGRINAPYHIGLNVENIVDPIAKQVLINKQLPNDLQYIMQYMAQKAVDGYVEDRNDISKQRIRNSEILVHLAQKLILAQYTEYKEQVMAGNTDAKFELPEGKIISQFNKLEIVQDMEYANPAEEMATITKISPVGKSVGGIADKEAVQLDARNVHPSYFGNIDPLDTAEGGNVGITQQLTVDAYLTSARGLFGTKQINNKEKAGILSTNSVFTPFLVNDDGNRILMAVNQVKQMLPLKDPEPPIVQSGYESILTNVLSDSFIKRAPCTGKIKSITTDYITVQCKEKGIQKVSILPVHLKSGSGKNTLSTFIPTVTTNQSVKKGDVIAEGSSVSQGTISLGRNLLTAYMPYKGYNYEDGIVISDKLVKNNSLTSLHGVEEEVEIDAKDKVLYIVDLGTNTKKGDPLIKKTMGDIDEIFGYEEDEDDSTDTHDGQLVRKSPGGKVVDIDVFCNIDPSNFPLLKDLIVRTNKKYGKPDKEKFTKRGLSVKGILIVFRIEQALVIGVGDKLCNRHGNKGIIALVEKEELMPRTPWGESVDIIFNPLGVLGRMNMGQMYELYCGLISKAVAGIISKAKTKAQVIKVFKDVYGFLDKSNNKEYTTKFIAGLNRMTDSQFKMMVQQIRTNNVVPIIVPPFNSPDNKDIMKALKYLNLKTSYKLTLPEFNTKTKNAVSVGYLYLAKLEHIGDIKLHARSTGPTVGKTLQPTAGKRRDGGQRMGEGDTWAMISYNTPIAMSEFFGPMSDDIKTKNEILTDIIQTGQAAFRETQASPTKDLLNAYFTGMMLEER